MRLLLLALAIALALGGCGDKKPRYPACGSDKDCRAGQRCVNNQCLQCADDSQCAKGESCVKGGCVLKTGACRDAKDCRDTQVCVLHRCSACTSDRDCGAGGRCANGRCLLRGACKASRDCADDEDCVGGQCSRGGRLEPPDVGCQFKPVYFGYDEVAIDAEGRTLLNAAGECIQQAPGRGVFIAGHTDPRGTEEYNIALSERRAQLVADYLARLGIDPARFRVIPKGETEAAGVDEGGWSQDRRVELEWQ
jgi:peptidoglycan-associated lipoprotein